MFFALYCTILIPCCAMSERRNRLYFIGEIDSRLRKRSPRPPKRAPKCPSTKFVFRAIWYARLIRPFRGINVDDPCNERARARARTRISIIVGFWSEWHMEILEKDGYFAYVKSYLSAIRSKLSGNISHIRLFNAPRYDNLMLPRSVNVRYASEP